ncbi:MAG: hypothetical protein K0S74_421 [Chlamydiales bacterium]|jgi:hypothetical protein|nr:hypothetical protein [Chlamydiales bacterium]
MKSTLSTLAMNLKRSNPEELDQISTVFDKELSKAAATFMGILSSPCGLEEYGELSYEQKLHQLYLYEQDVVSSVNSRNSFLKKIEGVAKSCFINSRELSTMLKNQIILEEI